MLAALTGPALSRQQAPTTFVVQSLTCNPKGPAACDPEWNMPINDTTKGFDERVGPALPPDNVTHRAELEKIIVSLAREAAAGGVGFPRLECDAPARQ